MTKKHIPRRSGVGTRLVHRPSWLPHPLSTRAAEQRRELAARRAAERAGDEPGETVLDETHEVRS